MNEKNISKHLDTLLGYEINDWERDELASKLATMSPSVRAQVIRQIPVIWPVSYALFFAFVDNIEKAAACLHPSQFPAWIHTILDVYESKGLKKAQLFMNRVEDVYLCRIRGETGLTFPEVKNRLIPFAKSISDHTTDLKAAKTASSDTETIFLPGDISYFANQEDNFTLYKLTVTFMVGLEQNNTFSLGNIPSGTKNTLTELFGRTHCTSGNPLSQFFNFFPNAALAKEIFYILEGIRVTQWIQKKFSGLIKDWQSGCLQLINQHTLGAAADKNHFLKQLQLLVLQCGLSPPVCRHQAESIIPKHSLEKILLKNTTVQDTLEQTIRLYQFGQELSGTYSPATPLPFMGLLDEERAYNVINARRETQKQHFIEALSFILARRAPTPPDNKEGSPLSKKQKTSFPKQASLLLTQDRNTVASAPPSKPESLSQHHSILDGLQDSFDDELQNLCKQIRQDLGSIPENYISAAVGRAGGSTSTGRLSENITEGQAKGPFAYDEWDYRRGGFRKNWCSLQEKEILPVGGTFIEKTLMRYKGQLLTLRRQFELMRSQERFQKRQRDGDEIDLDAVTEALADIKAGIPPSENLFIRLLRNQRSIASLFLIDMSSSTEGWINTTMKESLLLMCEALTMLGDSYAIYGFSGMRRTRCEFFKVKELCDVYDKTIKDKIAALTPTEYTRMGPALRHATTKLEDSEAKTKLLITLSDGKPEDYDDYKGIYAIEDTRHALIEAKAKGIHPFCITVDRQAHDYMSHLYGDVNYIFIDNAANLPKKIPEIYRSLTT